jgi:integrase
MDAKTKGATSIMAKTDEHDGKRPTGTAPKNCYVKTGSPYWWAKLEVRGQKFHRSTGCRTAREAEQFVAAKRVELGKLADQAEGKAVAPDPIVRPITFADAVQMYEEEKACRMSSFTDMKRYGECICIFFGVDAWLHNLLHRDLQRYYDHRRGEITVRNTPRSGASVNREIAYLRQVWKHAKRNGFHVGIEPEWGEIIDASAETVRIRELKPHEEERLFRVLRDTYPDLAPLVEFALLSGQRKTACTSLCWNDVNLVDREATFTLKSKGSIKRRHTIPLTDRMVEIIEAQPRVKGVDQVFTYVCDRGGRKAEGVHRKAGERYPYTPWGWRNRWQDALTKANVSDFRFHDLRHTTATRILRETNNLVIAQKLLGHTDLATTQRYAHAFLDDIRDGLNRVSEAQAEKRQRHTEEPQEEYEDNVIPLRRA